MFYYSYKNHTLASEMPLAYDALPDLPETGEILWLFRREPLAGRETFAVSDGGLFTAQEDGSYAVDIAEMGRTGLWVAAWSGAQWKLEVIDSQGRIILGAKVIWEAHRITE